MPPDPLPMPVHDFPPGALVSVLTPDMPLRALDYLAPEGGVATGAWVVVPLGRRQVIGVVWGPGAGGFDPARLRRIDTVLDAPPMQEELRQFLSRAADYTLTPLPAMLRLASRVPGLADPPQMRRLIRATGTLPARSTEARARVLEVLAELGGAGVPQADLCRAAGVGAAVIKTLIAQGVLTEGEVPRDLPYPRLDPATRGPELSSEQAAAAAALRAGLRQGGYGTTLLKGVTGSGKTEVYLDAVADVLAQGRQALVLLPEIALTADFLARVEARFGALPGEWHSGVSPAERRRLWRMSAEGGVGLVVGARSALFLPFRDLALIVVDEEHDTSYKQEEGVLYNARDMAVLRGSIAGARVVLASATPSLESWANARSGRYGRVDLGARFGTAELPDMQAVDLRAAGLPSNRWIAPALQQAITARLALGEQSLVFLNRRGFAPVTICRACGQQIGCDQCDARMVEHRFQQRLICHQCGASKPIPTACPSCGVEGRLAALGPGVERMAEEASALWPDARVKVLSSDLYSSARALKEDIAAIAEGGADIIVGTQIVAKGHNFPRLTLVGVVDADLGLQGSDLRAAERTFQLMRQVAGRAGRAERPGLALLQTHQPDHPVIRAILSGDEEGFWQAEAEARQMAGMPPYGRLAGIILSATDPQPPFDLGAELVRRDGPLRAVGAEVWGPAPAPIARVRGRHRVRLLVKAPKSCALQPALTAWLAQVSVPAAVRLAVDIDPQSFL
ncbi:replication restart DNA helicase PriA [Gemmobacter megaterium]|uniref:Replication restart protein PriA n=1 Tax=Gemmobacter megaterium TaxID=1086013 RepID=A0A1N7K4M9_9RHOB|nr:primosomal protein N' [Gemmobacter megaterium]GGE00370.1 primosomal protein N' [Gemmobacter megaterium]SIS56518.1 replication restart DNA helicase PriA [Gemmobacter megaterium]